MIEIWARLRWPLDRACVHRVTSAALIVLRTCMASEILKQVLWYAVPRVTLVCHPAHASHAAELIKNLWQLLVCDLRSTLPTTGRSSAVI